MIFNSFTFLIFLGIFLACYFATRGSVRLTVCLAGSYTFYGWWDYRFLTLIIVSTLIDYFIALALERTENPKMRRLQITLSLCANLGLLGFFKYFNFFVVSFYHVAQTLGLAGNVSTLNIILPVGISFYTFQTMSYGIDVYRKEIRAEHSLLRFATFVAFFPQLVAGPIVRARDFIPQLYVDHPFDWERTISGIGLVLVGYFKKIVIADGAALVVDRVFADPSLQSSLSLIVGIVLYAFQIYCDFSGYSDIAIGLARIMGFDFPVNFLTPYISTSFSEFWQRWHISLSTWLKDYLYIPLGGNRYGRFNTYRNLMITMLLGGLWHGADWKFVIWGGLHGTYLVLQRFTGAFWHRTKNALRLPNWLNDAILVILVFSLTCVAWFFFRADSAADAWKMLTRIVRLEDFRLASIRNQILVAKSFFVIMLLLVAESANRRYNLRKLLLGSPAFCVLAFSALLWSIVLFGVFGNNQFIYFQF